jgi:putative ABC transport system permease protein
VRAALDQHGARSAFARPAPAWLPLAARNALRRPGRLALTLVLLVAGGAMAMTALHMEAAYRRTVEQLPEMRGDDLEIRLAEPAPVELAAALARVEGVRTVEAWGYARAAFARPAELDVVATYPDGGHGRFVLLGPPAATALLRLPIAAGRWLEPGDTDALVVNSRLARSRRLAPGDRVSLSLDGIPQRTVVRQPDSRASGGSPVGTPSTWTVVGITDEIPPMAAYTTDQALASATRTDGRARLLRIATEPGADLRQVTRALERELAENRATPLAVMPFERLYRAIEAHLVLFVRIALLLSAVIGLVGLVGLAGAIGVGVAERTREIGVLKAIGASGGRVARWIVAEAALIGAVSWLLAAALSVPLAFGLVSLLNRAGALPASFAISPGGLAIWLPIAVAGSAAAALVPAWRAARLTVKDALAEV